MIRNAVRETPRVEGNGTVHPKQVVQPHERALDFKRGFPPPMRRQIRILGHPCESPDYPGRRGRIQVPTKHNWTAQAREVVDEKPTLLVVGLQEVTAPRELIGDRFGWR